MKPLVSLLIIFLLTFQPLKAEFITINKIVYGINTTLKTAYVDNIEEGIVSAVIQSKVTSNGISYPVTSIASNSFSWNSTLQYVTIPTTVTKIGATAFSGCTALQSIAIPDNVTSIGSSAFNGCPSLTTVDVGDGVTSIGDYAFNNCPSLTSITLGKSVASLGRYAFKGCTSLKTITIPASVTSIAEGAFKNCTGLISIYFDDGNLRVTFVDNWLEGCSIGKVYYGRSIVGQKMFYGCTGLITVTLGAMVRTIASQAFDCCGSIRTVYCMATEAPMAVHSDNYPQFVGDVFDTAILNIPEGSLAAYQASSCWENFENVRERDFARVGAVHSDRPKKSLDVYTLGGVLLLRGADTEDINNLPPGIYIVGGKKIRI